MYYELWNIYSICAISKFMDYVDISSDIFIHCISSESI